MNPPPPSPLPPLRATKSLTICNKNQTPFCQQGKKYPVDVHPVSWEKKKKKINSTRVFGFGKAKNKFTWKITQKVCLLR
jgi:hypothetical protein